MAKRGRRKKVQVPDISQDKMRKVWEETFGKKQKVLTPQTPFRGYAVFALFLNLSLIAIVLAMHKFLPPEVPLFYGMPEGQGQLASSWALILPSATSLLILGINLLIASFVENDFIKRALILAGIGASFFSATTTIRIMFLVGSIF